MPGKKSNTAAGKRADLIQLQVFEPRSSDKKVHVVVGALENPKYRWRTIDGVTKETGVDAFTVKRVINKMSDEVVKSSIASTSGEDLFTTRRHLKETESFLSRIGAAIRNRAS